jgi:hypothetical protein
VDQQPGGDGFPLDAGDADFRVVGELPERSAEKPPAAHRSAQVAHVPAKDGIELRKQILATPGDLNAGFLILAHLVAYEDHRQRN